MLLRIYYEDTDAGGIVYHAQYLKFLERARTEMLRKLGFSQQELLSENKGFVVKNINIDYIKPAKLDDQILVETYLTNISHCSLNFIQKIINIETKQPLISANVLVAYIDTLKAKPMKIPSELKNLLISEIERGDSNG